MVMGYSVFHIIFIDYGLISPPLEVRRSPMIPVKKGRGRGSSHIMHVLNFWHTDFTKPRLSLPAASIVIIFKEYLKQI